MTTDHDLESRVRDLLRAALDHETGPHPTWAGSPAAERVEQDPRRRMRWPMRVLAVAALMGVVGGAALLAGAPDEAEPTPSPPAWVGLPAGPHVLLDGTDSGVPVTVIIAAPLWNGEPNGGVLCWDDPVDTCAGPPEGAGIFAFASREYHVYADPCHRPGPRPDTTATTVDELVDAMRGDTQVHRWGSAPEDITVDGYAGKRIVLRMVLPDFPSDCDDDIFALFGLPGDDLARQSQGKDQIEEVWAVDVDGLIVVLDGAYYADTPQSAVDQLRAILGSATFE